MGLEIRCIILEDASVEISREVYKIHQAELQQVMSCSNTCLYALYVQPVHIRPTLLIRKQCSNSISNPPQSISPIHFTRNLGM
jgi:hypothetical protein